ncbi:3-oxo-Delta(4,5)-steroid 5-beta-reductase [Citrus sinensis]|nr:3-oxo-Delta(4,5)-steroid 5-beta-reductase [Citrus sinensis]
MADLSFAEAFKSPTALGDPWEVYSSAWRPKQSWFPSSTVDHYITFDATNSGNTTEKLSPLSNEITHVFWLQFKCLRVKKLMSRSTSLFRFLTSEHIINVLKSSLNPRLTHITQKGPQYYMDLVHDPAHSAHANPHDPPLRDDLPRLPYRNFYCALEDLVASYTPAISYSIHHSSIIIGTSSRSVYNSLLTLDVYPAICQHEGLPFMYPIPDSCGSIFVTCRMPVCWPSKTYGLRSRPMRRTRPLIVPMGMSLCGSVWKVTCEVFGVEFVPFDENDEFDFVGMMKQKAKVWDEIAEQHGLYNINKLEEITCFRH